MIESSEILLDNFCKAVGDLVECYSGTQPEVAADIASPPTITITPQSSDCVTTVCRHRLL